MSFVDDLFNDDFTFKPDVIATFQAEGFRIQRMKIGENHDKSFHIITNSNTNFTNVGWYLVLHRGGNSYVYGQPYNNYSEFYILSMKNGIDPNYLFFSKKSTVSVIWPESRIGPYSIDFEIRNKMKFLEMWFSDSTKTNYKLITKIKNKGIDVFDSKFFKDDITKIEFLSLTDFSQYEEFF